MLCYEDSPLPGRNAMNRLTQSSGQALVEFTFTFLILLIVAWIPADFGLAFYTGQIAQNAAREGARIAATERSLVSGSTSCTMPSCCLLYTSDAADERSSVDL